MDMFRSKTLEGKGENKFFIVLVIIY